MRSSSKRRSVGFPTLPKTIITVAVLTACNPVFVAHGLCQAFASDVGITGVNELRLSRGYDISFTDADKPWDYLVNTMDITAQAKTFYSKLRFDVQEPSMGFNPVEPVYREYLSRRTFGFEIAPLTLEAGHVTTQFGRGLTLSLKEDRDIEQYVILDGVYGRLLYPWLTFQGIAGRPYQWRNRPLALKTMDLTGLGDTVALIDAADLRMRNNVEGVYVELFDPIEKPFLPFLSACQVGGGLVRYSSGVGPLQLGYHDTVTIQKPFWYQDRETWYLPSASANVAYREYALSFDQAWMTGTIHNYYNPMDSMRGPFDSVFTTPTAPSTYVSANAALYGVSLLAEYKNYHYAETVFFSEEIGSFLIPPHVRYMHSWHLLNKHLLSNLMADDIGYKVMLNWSPLVSSLLTVDFCYGGRHERESSFSIMEKSAYWEAYAEWSQDVSDRILAKAGVDYGKLDPEQPKVTFRTLAGQVNAGPYRERHSFGIILENQLNDKPFLAEQDEQALKNLIARIVPQDSLTPVVDPVSGDTLYKDTLLYDYLVPDAERSSYTQRGLNLLLTLTYGFAPWLTLSMTLEREVVLEDMDNIHVVTDIASSINSYASFGLVLRPFPDNTLTLEYGSMSGGKKCTLGTCVDLPAFRGFRMNFTSMF
ncbi:MAG: hypothetical protein JXA71_07985 [Chitinispirillaceae bacterium]|nr:hypothetical protein [Chitinispirillaceae bacterium]